MGVERRVDQDGVREEHQPRYQKDEDPIWFVEDVGDQLNARNNQEGRECDPIEHSKYSEGSKSSAGANLHMFSVVSNAIDQDQTPKHNKRFDAVGECMGLVCPGNIRGRDQRNGDPAIS